MLLLSTALQPELEVSVPTERLRGRIEDAIAGLQLNNGRRSYPVASSSRSWFGWLNDLFFGSSQRAFSYATVAALVIAAVFGIVLFVWRGQQTYPTSVV